MICGQQPRPVSPLQAGLEHRSLEECREVEEMLIALVERAVTLVPKEEKQHKARKGEAAVATGAVGAAGTEGDAGERAQLRSLTALMLGLGSQPVFLLWVAEG